MPTLILTRTYWDAFSYLVKASFAKETRSKYSKRESPNTYEHTDTQTHRLYVLQSPEAPCFILNLEP